VVGYPRFVPQILDMVTMDEVLHDLYVRQFACDTQIYGLTIRTLTFSRPLPSSGQPPPAWPEGTLENRVGAASSRRPPAWRRAGQRSNGTDLLCAAAIGPAGGWTR